MNRSGTGENYIRLTGRKRTWTGSSQAWLGNDHLLVVHSIRFVERYQRFALSDVQAIVISQGGRRGIWQSLIVLLCFSLGVSSTSTFGRGFFAAIGSIALTLAIIDIARGPRCRCLLQTAVSRERLLCIARMRTARSFLATVAPAIEAAQRAIPLEGLTQMDELAEMEEFAQTPLPEPSAPTTPTRQPPVIAPALGYAPEILFVILMLDSVLMFITLRATIAMAFGALPIIYFAEFVLGILALVQSRARNATVLAVLVAAFVCVLIDPFALSGRAVWPGVLFPPFASRLRRACSLGIFRSTLPPRRRYSRRPGARPSPPSVFSCAISKGLSNKSEFSPSAAMHDPRRSRGGRALPRLPAILLPRMRHRAS